MSDASELLARPADRAHLAGFVPRFRWPSLTRGPSGLPGVETESAAVLRADIVEFSALTDTMADTPGGSERLARLLIDRLGAFVAIAEGLGGELANLAGDCLIIAWFAADETAMGQALLGAIAAGLRIQEDAALSGSLRLRVSVGGGDIHHHEVGGEADEWHAVLNGPALREAVEAGLDAEPGDVVVGPSAWARICKVARGRAISRRATRIISVARPHAVPPRPVPVEPPAAVLHPIIPPMIRQRLRGARDGWNGEFRLVTPVFTVLRHPEHANVAEALPLLHRATALLQVWVSRFGGQVHQVRADENGITMISVFGLPPNAHEDDAARAVEAALALHAEWGRLGVTSSSGIATGRVFCASLGGSTRAFTLVGPAMNLAARLMQLGAGVVCDGETMVGGRKQRRVHARQLSPRPIRGKAEPIVAYAPYSVSHEGPDGAPSALVGRDRESANLADALESLLAGCGATVQVLGEAGMGKSALIRNLLELAGSKGVRCLAGFADDSERSSTFFAWRLVFRDLFGLDDPDCATKEGATGRALDVLGAQSGLAPLLSEILAIELSDSVETRQLTGEARATTVRQLLLRQLEVTAVSQPLMIVIEDAHWLDSSSWTLLAEIAEAALPVLLVVTSRPTGEDAGPVLRLEAAPRSARLELAALDQEQTGRVIAATIGVPQVDEAVSELILDWTSGNPLFIEEVAPLLRSQGLLSVIGGRATLAASGPERDQGLAGHLSRRGMPASLEGIVMARFDQLEPTKQAVLRSASIVGKMISVADVASLMPALDGAAVARAIEDLAATGFLIAPAAATTFAFRHVVLRDVVYHSIAFADRQHMHGIFARLLAARPDGSVGLADAIIGHHFEAAGDDDDAAPYLVSAAQKARRSFANLEAISLATMALAAIRRQLPGSRGSARSAWRAREVAAEFVLGAASHALSRYDDAQRHSEAALRLAGLRIPRSGVGLFGAATGQLLRQAAYRRFGVHGRAIDRETRETFTDAASALEHLSEIRFFAGDQIAAAHSALLMLNISERARLPGSTALGFAHLAGMAAVVPVPGIAASYRRRAVEELTRTTDLHAVVWASVVIALTYISTAEWEPAKEFLERAATAAEAANDRRSWRAAMESTGTIAGFRGDWAAATESTLAMLASAERDRDQRWMISAWRELAYYEAHLGRWDDVERRIRSISLELERGVTAERVAIEQEVFALTATLELERGASAAASAAAGKALESVLRTKLSFPLYYWTVFLVARAYLNLAFRGEGPDSLNGARKACRALKRQAKVHRVARPAYHLAAGALEQLSGRPERARQLWARAGREAEAMQMAYEPWAAALMLGAKNQASLGLVLLSRH